MLNLVQANILVSDAGQACLADVGVTRVAGELTSSATSNTSSSGGEHTLRWCPPERLDPERFGFEKSNPTKKSDIYSMAMTIYEVSFLKRRFRQSVDLVPGLDRQGAVSRIRRISGDVPYHRRCPTREAKLRPHPRLHRRALGNDDVLLERGSH